MYATNWRRRKRTSTCLLKPWGVKPKESFQIGKLWEIRSDCLSFLAWHFKVTIVMFNDCMYLHVQQTDTCKNAVPPWKTQSRRQRNQFFDWLLILAKPNAVWSMRHSIPFSVRTSFHVGTLLIPLNCRSFTIPPPGDLPEGISASGIQVLYEP